MKNVMLNNGIEMPILGFGVYQISDLEECERCVREAVDVGYRLIDTASGYENEQAVGKALKSCGVPREELFITTKLWVQDAGYEPAKRAFERSLARLQLDYLDLYLIHQPFNDIYGAWRALEELYHSGKIRAIGVSNFHPDRLMDFLVNHEVAPAVNQIETHPFRQQLEASDFMKKHGIQMESWGPFLEGKNNVFHNEILVGIAQKYGKSVAQVILRWLIQREIVCIPKSVHRERMVQNFDVFDFQLTSADMAAIQTLDTNRTYFFEHRDPEVVKMIGELRFDI